MYGILIYSKSTNFAIIFPSIMALFAVIISGFINHRISQNKYKTDFLKDKLLNVFDDEIEKINLWLILANCDDNTERNKILRKYLSCKLSRTDKYLEPSYWLLPKKIELKINEFNKIIKKAIFPDVDKHKKEIIEKLKK